MTLFRNFAAILALSCTSNNIFEVQASFPPIPEPTAEPTPSPRPSREPSPKPSQVPSQQPTIRPSAVPTPPPTTLTTPAPTFPAPEYLSGSTYASSLCTNTPLSTVVYALNVCMPGSLLSFFPTSGYVVVTYSFTTNGLIAVNVNQYGSSSTCTGPFVSSFVQLSTICSLGAFYTYSANFPTLNFNQAQLTTSFSSSSCASSTALTYEYTYSAQCTAGDSDGLSSSPSCSGGSSFVQNHYLGTNCKGFQQYSITKTVFGCLKQQSGNAPDITVYYIKQQCPSGTTALASSSRLIGKEQKETFEGSQHSVQTISPEELDFVREQEQKNLYPGSVVLDSTISELIPIQVDEIKNGLQMEDITFLRSLSTDDRLNPTIGPTKAPSGFGSAGYIMQSTFSNAECIGSIASMTALPTGVCINEVTATTSGTTSTSYAYIYTASPGNTGSGGNPYFIIYQFSTSDCYGSPLGPVSQSNLDGSCVSGGVTYSYSTYMQFPSGGYTEESFFGTSTCSGTPYQTVWRPFVACDPTTSLGSSYYATISAASSGLVTTYYSSSLCSGTAVATSSVQVMSSCIVTLNNGTTSALSTSVSNSLYSAQSNAATGLNTGGAVRIAIACVVIAVGFATAFY